MRPDDDQPKIQSPTESEWQEPDQESNEPIGRAGGDEGSPGWRTPPGGRQPGGGPGAPGDPPIPGDEGSRGW